MAQNGLLTEQEWSEPPGTFRGYSQHPPAAPTLVRRDSTVRLCSCVLSSKVRSIGMLPQHRMSCGRPTDQKGFAGYIRGVRVTASWGATWITPGNHLRAYFDLRGSCMVNSRGFGAERGSGKASRTTTPKPVPGYPVNSSIAMGY